MVMRVFIAQSTERVDISETTITTNVRTPRPRLWRETCDLHTWLRRRRRRELPVDDPSMPSRRGRTTSMPIHPRRRRCRLRERTSSTFWRTPTTRAVATPRRTNVDAAAAGGARSHSTTTSTADIRRRPWRQTADRKSDTRRRWRRWATRSLQVCRPSRSVCVVEDPPRRRQED